MFRLQRVDSDEADSDGEVQASQPTDMWEEVQDSQARAIDANDKEFEDKVRR